MEPWRFIRSGIAASALGHLSALTMVLVFAEVHPFGLVTAEPITVDLVSPDEARIPEKAKPEPKAQPSDAFDLSSKSADSSSPAPATEPATAPPQQAAALSTPQQANAQPQPPSTSPSPAFIPPEPDLSIKYHVMLGLPPDLPQGLPQDKPGDGFDAAASEKAQIASSLVTEFRQRLKTCSKLPASIAPSDNVKVKLRVFMTLEGRIASEPVVVEGTATLKGLDLRQSAVDALQACQPYTMLPADRYGEWKVLDLSFTPQDFAGPT